jgi:hypothetical protein
MTTNGAACSAVFCSVFQNISVLLQATHYTINGYAFQFTQKIAKSMPNIAFQIIVPV